jgi:Subtilase family
LFFAFAGILAVHASDLDTIGVTVLREVTTNLNGAGIRVAQPEAIDAAGTTNFEVNPGTVEKPLALFTYISSDGSTDNFPNALGGESGHADAVAGNFYGIPNGVATNIAHVDNYDADYFAQVSAIPVGVTTNYSVSLEASSEDAVVNQSFIFSDVDTNNHPISIPVKEQQAVDSAYDNFAAQHNVLFVSGAGNGSPPGVCAPATCYNGIGVGAYLDGINYSSVGPTLDNGRAKPDITAPSSVTSFSTPLVAGAAALLMQAGLRGDGGADTNAADDIRTVKALLLNGAIKPADWTNDPPSPLDNRYGAGVLNAFNSYEELAGGEHGYTVSNSVTSGAAHLPPSATNSVGALSGWDFNTISSTSGGFLSSATDGINHYFFNVTNSLDQTPFTATATLVWNRQQNQKNINNLELFLYNAANSNLVASSTSIVDNVQQIYVPQLPPGRYDLQVWKAGGSIVSSSETYALAFEFFATALSIAPTASQQMALSWPVYPDGFVLESATNLTPPIVWSTNGLSSASVTNHENYVLLNLTNANQFFRLRRP